jgi:hypothetical protein
MTNLLHAFEWTLATQTQIPNVTFEYVEKLSWVPLVVSVAQTLYISWLTYYVFLAGSRQRVAERRAAFFHALVLDKGLANLQLSFENLRMKLESRAENLEKHKNFWTAEIIDEFMAEMTTEYNVMLSSTLRRFATRVSVMDRNLAKRLSDHSEQFEDKVTMWFLTFAKRSAFEGCDSLPDILAEGENEVYRLLHDFEFGEQKKSK